MATGTPSPVTYSGQRGTLGLTAPAATSTAQLGPDERTRDGEGIGIAFAATYAAVGAYIARFQDGLRNTSLRWSTPPAPGVTAVGTITGIADGTWTPRGLRAAMPGFTLVVYRTGDQSDRSLLAGIGDVFAGLFTGITGAGNAAAGAASGTTRGAASGASGLADSLGEGLQEQVDTARFWLRWGPAILILLGLLVLGLIVWGIVSVARAAAPSAPALIKAAGGK